VNEHSALRAGIFKASGSTDPMGILQKRREAGLRVPDHRLDEPRQVTLAITTTGLRNGQTVALRSEEKRHYEKNFLDSRSHLEDHQNNYCGTTDLTVAAGQQKLPHGNPGAGQVEFGSFNMLPKSIA